MTTEAAIDETAPRWSAMAYASTAIGLGGAIAATALMLVGRDSLAMSIIMPAFLFCLLQSSMSTTHNWQSLADFDDPLDRMRFAFLGTQVTLAYLLVGIFIEFWKTGHGEPVTFSSEQLTIGLFTALALGQAAPRAMRLWRGPPPQG